MPEIWYSRSALAASLSAQSRKSATLFGLPIRLFLSRPQRICYNTKANPIGAESVSEDKSTFAYAPGQEGGNVLFGPET